MKLNENKDFDQEVKELSARLSKVSHELSPQKVYVSSWKGVDDILDNVSGVAIANEEGKLVAQTVLVELDCHNNYLDLAKAILEKTISELKTSGFEVVIKSSI